MINGGTNMKKLVLGSIAVFIAWTALDFLFHGLILGDSYKDTASLWRPMEEAKMLHNSFAVLVSSIMFASIYMYFIGPKKINIGALYGLMFGIAAGVSMGLGSYAFMPVSIYMAMIWILTGVAEGLVGGVIVGAIIKPDSVGSA